MRPRRELLLLGLLFTGTGCTALLAEQAFEKLLSTLLGATTPAAATVLAVYFAGLSLGAMLYGRFARSPIRNPLRVYGLLEGAVALWALLLSWKFDRLVSFFAPVLSLGVDSFVTLQVLRLAVASVWILPATIPMGATFPAIVDSLERIGTTDHRRSVARFYGWNLAGAIAGSVAGPFYAFPRWGVDGTLFFVSLVNGAVAVVGLLLARTAHRNEPRPRRSEVAAAEPARASTTLLSSVAFYSGFQFFALEVLWTHLIACVLGNSVYAFAAMLGIVLIGLGLGAGITSARFPGVATIPFAEVGTALAVGALFVAATGGLWPDVPGALSTYGHSIRGFGLAEFLRWYVAGLLLLPAATVLGMVYPTLFRLREFPLENSAGMAGRLVAGNALGSIAGALLTGFVLIPRFGSEPTLVLLSCLAAVLGIGILWKQGAPRRRVVFGVLAIAAALLQPRWNRLALTSGQHVSFAPGPVGPATVLRFFSEDTTGGFTTVVQNISGDGRPYLTLLTNGKFEGNDLFEITAQTGVALAPALFLKRFDDALTVGLGTGRTAYVTSVLGFHSVEVAEIAPGVVRASPLFAHINGAVLSRPNTTVYVEDGRNVLLLRKKKYDLITMEVSSVWFAGATNLYSREFYRVARERLKEEGVLQQWIQIHHIGFGELGTAMATLNSVFQYVSFWVVGGQGLLVASDRPQQIQPVPLEAIRIHSAELGWSADQLHSALRDLVRSRLLAPEDVARLVAGSHFPYNTDRNRRLEYRTPRYYHLPGDFTAQNLGELLGHASFPSPLVSPEARGPLAEVCRRIRREDYLELYDNRRR